MSFCVFIHRADSIYDDSPAVQYQFPKRYLGRAEQCLGDWIVYLEPSKVRNSRGYFAVAKVMQIIADPKSSGMFLALIEPGSYLDFSEPVAYNTETGPIELGLLNDAGKLSGRAQAAVRPISPEDFYRIVEKGLGDHEPILPRLDLETTSFGFEEAQSSFVYEQERDRASQLTSRLVRDKVFRKAILKAYDARCCITGLKLINGGGRAEVDAAHIRPVHANGPDSVNNGLALSGTAHWMFDRGLISLDDDLRILVSRHVNDIDGVRGFINRSGYAQPPAHHSDRPHTYFLYWHRENCYKG